MKIIKILFQDPQKCLAKHVNAFHINIDGEQTL